MQKNVKTGVFISVPMLMVLLKNLNEKRMISCFEYTVIMTGVSQLLLLQVKSGYVEPSM